MSHSSVHVWRCVLRQPYCVECLSRFWWAWARRVHGHGLDFVWRDLLEVTIAEGVAVKHGDVVTRFKAREFVEEPGDSAFASATAASGDEDHFHGTLG